MKTFLQWLQKAAGIWFTCTSTFLFVLYLTFNFSLSESAFNRYLLVFAGVALIGSTLWQRYSHRLPCPLIFEIIRTLLACCLAAFFIFYGLFKVFHLQFTVPAEIMETKAKDLTGFWKMWVFYAHSDAYNRILGGLELLTALLLLFGRTRLCGVLLFLAMMMNIVTADYLYGVVAMQTTSLIITLTALYLLHFDWKQLAAVLFAAPAQITVQRSSPPLLNAAHLKIMHYVWLAALAAIAIFTIKDIRLIQKL